MTDSEIEKMGRPKKNNQTLMEVYNAVLSQSEYVLTDFPYTACLIPKKITNDHYGHPIASYRGKYMRVSRIALMCETDQTGKGLKALHYCKTKECININHLFWGTHQDQITQMNLRGNNRGLEKMREYHKNKKR